MLLEKFKTAKQPEIQALRQLEYINMLPLPALDGGRILFVLFTMITGKKVSEKVEGTVHIIGLLLLLALMLYVTKNDIFLLIG